VKGLLQTTGFFIFAVSLSAFFGLIIPVLGPKYSLVVLAGFVGCSALFVKTEVILLGLLVLTLCIVGPLNYFGVVNLHWIPYIIGLFLYIKLILEKFRVSSSGSLHAMGNNSMTALQWAVLLFFAILTLTTVFSPPGSHLFLIASRNYCFLWSVYLLLNLGHINQKFFSDAWKLMTGIAILQLPFALFQNLVIARGRGDNSSWDAVIGTFFGYKDAGGDSGGMAIFLLTVLAIVLSLRRRNLLGNASVLLISMVAMVSILLAEVKIIYVLLPIAFIGVYRSHLLRNAPLALLGIGIIALLFATVFLVYDKEYSESEANSQKSIGEKVEEIFKYSQASDAYLGHGGVGRATALAIWWRGNDWSDPTMYIGNGMGSSAISQQYGELGGKIGERYFPLEIDTSAAAVLLWETGIFGLISFTSILILAAARARRLAGNDSIPEWNGAVLDATPAILTMYLITLPYHKNAIGGSEAGQLLLLFFLGHVGYWSSKSRAIHMQ
jgi:hypothetical protein